MSSRINSSKLALVMVGDSVVGFMVAFLDSPRRGGRVKGRCGRTGEGACPDVFLPCVRVSCRSFARLMPTTTCNNSIPQLRAAGISERIHHGFFHPDFFQMSMPEAATQNLIDRDAQILGRRNLAGEFGQRVQVLMSEALEDFLVYEAIEIHQIT